MARLTITRGVPGSGKSTWAKAQAGNPAIVSRDSLRSAMFGTDGPDYYAVPKETLKRREDYITKVEYAAIEQALRAGIDVISDNTYIEFKYVKQIANVAHKVGAEVEVKVFDVPLNVAMKRVGSRADAGGRMVPDEVIRKMHDRFQGNKHMVLPEAQTVEPYTGTPGKPKAFMVDIDGTLAHMRDYRSPFEWEKVGLDDADEVIVDLVNILGSSNFALGLGHLTVIVMSGRDESCRAETEKWLGDYINHDELFMRPEKDMRPDNIVKAELFDTYVRDNYDVQFVLDDRDQVVDMWRSMGIKTLQVEPGAF